MVTQMAEQVAADSRVCSTNLIQWNMLQIVKERSFGYYILVTEVACHPLIGFNRLRTFFELVTQIEPPPPL